MFDDALRLAQSTGSIPHGYGMLPHEWEQGEYPSYELLPVGRRVGNELRINLPDEIWRPRAQLWVQALDIYYSICV
ncbi:hypothetical protein BDZ89DRAFT_890185, partial [Hymenopellis radicata]